VSTSDLDGVLTFLRSAERLKNVTRSAWTSEGRPESVAEHTWRLCLMALVLADRTNGMVRSESQLRSAGSVPLHIDAEAALVEKDRVLVQIGLEYNVPGAGRDVGQEPPETRYSQVRESIRAILQDGKPLVVSESADPITDRKVKVEVKATILR